MPLSDELGEMISRLNETVNLVLILKVPAGISFQAAALLTFCTQVLILRVRENECLD